MKNDISIYENIKRNEECPCGSGKIFKKCCMSEYREAKKSLSAAKVSTYTPLQPLSQSEKDEFTEFYSLLLTFSHQYENNSEVIYIEDENESVSDFILKQRPYFYENRDEIIDQYIAQKNPSKQQLLILEALRDAKFDTFFLLSKSDDSAVLMDTDEKLYNIQALHSPLSEIFNFPSKYLTLHTVVIPYKDCYITDGIYGGSDNMTKEVEHYLDNVPFNNPVIHYNKNDNITNLPLVFNFSFACNVDQFKKMEKIVLEEIPQAFSEGMIALFDDTYSFRKNIISSFLRSTDLSYELNCEEGDQTFAYILGGSPVQNFEFGNQTDVIPYDILKKYYVQKSIEKSKSRESYRKSKSKNAFEKMLTSYSSFYTMLGIVHIEEDKVDDFIEYLQAFNTKEKREELVIGLENLFEELSRKAGFEIRPVFLGVGTDLDSIYEEINLYRDYMASQTIFELDDLRSYSLNKGIE